MIRPMTLADYDDLITLFTTTPGISVRDADSRENIDRYLQRNPGLSFVAEEQGRITGCCMAGHDGKRGYLQHLVVATSARGNGLGRQLARACVDALAAEGILKSHLFVLKDNQDGHGFWRQMQWKNRSEDFEVYSWIEGDNPNV
ncbi:GNAT family N-acetyltransferase [Pokkaliibacter sp. MBI-7]|uniref:GNAT family N-acetyltransferase n=1 Tax=Pokkaliibacter sp. MBI-7 TaxID=3040600 RepID=UPI0024470314|nr:GNAT family N-acetyltransferase [Pokkaliibacter sp. MBI-7]MDH2431370.1 GNAT family N-acetyltransferase [Pokkaliibacter sp. MBI-7]